MFLHGTKKNRKSQHALTISIFLLNYLFSKIYFHFCYSQVRIYITLFNARVGLPWPRTWSWASKRAAGAARTAPISKAWVKHACSSDTLAATIICKGWASDTLTAQIERGSDSATASLQLLFCAVHLAFTLLYDYVLALTPRTNT